MASQKLYRMEDIKNSNKTWIVIHNSVYDVAKYLSEHPGGEEILLEAAGKNATADFEDVSHSSDAREIMKAYKIGELVEEDRTTWTPYNHEAEQIKIQRTRLYWSAAALVLGTLTIVAYRYFYHK